MSSQEGVISSYPPLFNGTNFIFWKFTMRAYLQALGTEVWTIVECGYQYPTSIPTNNVGNK